MRATTFGESLLSMVSPVEVARQNTWQTLGSIIVIIVMIIVIIIIILIVTITLHPPPNSTTDLVPCAGRELLPSAR